MRWVREASVGSAPDRPGDRGMEQLLGRVLALGGAVGLAAASVLLVEKISLLKDPTYVPSCSINPILSCGSVMKTAQAEAFGFPNPVLGVAGFAIVMTVGLAMLAGAEFRPWFWWGLQAGVGFGAGFVHWLIFQSLYRIGALCPYCMVVWAVMIPVFWYTSLTNVERSRQGWLWVRRVSAFHGVGLTTWYLLVSGLVLHRFWSYWSTLLR